MIGLLVAALLAATPEAGKQRELGKALFKQGRVEEAIASFEQAVRLDPADAVAWYNLAYANRKAQKFEQAAVAYQKYTALAPGDPDGYFGLAESLRSLGRKAEAAEAYTHYISKEQRASEQKWVELAKRRIAELSAAAAPPAPAAPAATPPPAAQPVPSQAARNQSASDSLARGDKAFAARQYQVALFAYQDAIMAAPDNVEARVQAGRAYEKMGHDDEAATQWNKALQLDPQNATARDLLAAARDRRAGFASPPPAPTPPLATPADEAAARAHYTKAVALINERKFDEGVAELELALAAKPSFALALVARGSAHIGQGRNLDALADYTAAQKADPSLASPLFGLAEAYRAMGQNEKAVQFYRQYAASTAPDAQQSLQQYALQNAQALSQ